jgi:GTPase SAR1 family protein
MNSFKLKEVPFIMETFQKKVKDQHGQPINFIIQELPGDENGIEIRKQTCKKSNLLLIFFSLVDPKSFDQVDEYFKEFEQFNIPRVLVGTKVDLRESEKFVEELGKSGIQPISTDQGKEKEKKFGFDGYIEIDCISEYGFPDNGMPQDSLETCLKFSLNNIGTQGPTPKK